MKTNVPIFKFVAGLKSIRYVCRRLISKFVDDENDLHLMYVMVDYITLILLWVGNNHVRFLRSLQ